MKKKQLLSLLLVAAMTVSMAACGKKDDESKDAATYAGIEGLTGDYDNDSSVIYDAVFGDFYSAYQTAMAETDPDVRYALEAIAEAKLLQTGAILPTTSQGGAYAITRNAPNTVSSVMWGGDAQRYEMLLATTDWVSAEDWAAMRALYAKLQGTGTYYAECKKYLADHGYTLTDTYNMAYTGDNQSWDVFTEWNATLYEPLCNTFDNLMQYDIENVLQPALAESYEKTVNGDGTVTYTFHIRDAKWVDSQGREFADVKADDWVAGAEHLFDCASQVETLLTSDGAKVVGADEYYAQETTDFSTVGIKAVDDKTLEITLTEDVPYFLTMLTYSNFSPLCRDYYRSQGGTFASDADGYQGAGKYGTSPDNIVYCGPYLVTNATRESSITFKANPSYWNAANIAIKNFNWIYDAGDDVQKTYDNAINGVTTSTGLSTPMVEICKADGDMFEKNVHVSATNATSYIVSFNMNRQVFANFNNDKALVSTKTDEQKSSATTALQNRHFRLALCYSVDRVTHNATKRGADLASTNLNNSYTPGAFVQISKDVTVSINGTDTTFAAGTYYGEIVQAQLVADGSPIKAWDPTANDGIGSSSGFDGWYNPTEAAKELEIAIEELKAVGLEISAENPIVLDYPSISTIEAYVNSANVFKQSVESCTNGCVIVNIVQTADLQEWYDACYYTTRGAEANYDINDLTGWSADYGDPCSYLGTLLPDYVGAFGKQFGIF